MGTHFEIVDSCAKMPGSCWGRYRRVAVLEVKDGYQAKSIDARPHYVVRVVETWEKLNSGKGVRDAHTRALREAEELKVRLESERVSP